MYSSERNTKALELLKDAQRRLDWIKSREDAPYYSLFGLRDKWKADVKKWEYIVLRLKKWYHPIFMEYVAAMEAYLGEQTNIREEMDIDMQESGVAQGEIESCLNHWNNKYLIIKK